MATMARKYEHSEAGTAAEQRITRLSDLCYIKQANGFKSYEKTLRHPADHTKHMALNEVTK